VSGDGAQFIRIIEGLDLNHVQRNNLVKIALSAEGSVAVAYASLNIAMEPSSSEGEEVLDIAVSDARNYILGTWRVIRDAAGNAQNILPLKTLRGTDPERYPNTWFLCSPAKVSMVERSEYEELWTQLRGDAMRFGAPEAGFISQGAVGVVSPEATKVEDESFDEVDSFFGLPTPLTLFGLPRGKVILHELQSPGDGIAVAYIGVSINVTLFLYDFGNPDIPSDLHSDVVQEHFRVCMDDVLKLAPRALADVKFVAAYCAGVKHPDVGHEYLCGQFEGADEHGPLSSFLYLTVKGGKFVKLRMTCRQEVDKAKWLSRSVADAYADQLWPSHAPIRGLVDANQ
jgi:hypothetical protein